MHWFGFTRQVVEKQLASVAAVTLLAEQARAAKERMDKHVAVKQSELLDVQEELHASLGALNASRIEENNLSLSMSRLKASKQKREAAAAAKATAAAAAGSDGADLRY